MDRKSAVHLQVRSPDACDLAFDPIRAKCNLGVAGALQDLAVHAAVAYMIPALSRSGIRKQTSMYSRGCRVVPHLAALQSERAVHCVQNIAQSKIDTGRR